MLDHPNDQSAYERRFERIEASLEVIAAGDVRHDQQISTLFQAMGDIANGHKQLLKAQVLMVDEVSKIASAQKNADEQIARMALAQARLADAQARLADAQAKSEIAQAETQGKLDALIHMWDDMIRRQNRKDGEPPVQ